jgi:flagellar motor switch protein FliN/FliY
MSDTETNEITETTTPEASTATATEVLDPTPQNESAAPEKSAENRTPEIQRIMKLQVPIIVRLAEKVLPVGEITQLVPGAIIEFNKTVGENLDLMINNKLIGNGQAVKVGEKFGLKITQLGSLQEMIKAMGQ